MAELADARGSGPRDRKVVGVQVPPSALALEKERPSRIAPTRPFFFAGLGCQRARFSPPGGGKGGGIVPARGRGGGATELRRAEVGGGKGDGEGGGRSDG